MNSEYQKDESVEKDESVKKDEGIEKEENLEKDEADRKEDVSPAEESLASVDAGSSQGLQQIKQELAQAKSDYLYLRAEFDNYRKNVIKDRSQYLKYGSERLIIELLGIVDNFERALNTEVNQDTYESLYKGIELTAGQLKSLLNRFGVIELNVEGKPFDPSDQEAITSEEADITPGYVVKVFRKGYRLHDRVIRPAQVSIAKARDPVDPEKSSSQSNEV